MVALSYAFNVPASKVDPSPERYESASVANNCRTTMKAPLAWSCSSLCATLLASIHERAVDLVLGTDLLNVFRMRIPNAVLRKQELELLVRAYAARDLDIDLSDAVVRLDRAPGLQPDSMEGVLCCGLQHSTWRKITSLIKDEGMRLRSAQPLISIAQLLAEQALVGESLLADGKIGLLLVEPECITTLVWSGNGTEHARTKQGSDSRASASEALVRMCGQTGLTPDETVVGLGTGVWREGPLDTIVLPEDLLGQQPITGLLTSLSGAAR